MNPDHPHAGKPHHPCLDQTPRSCLTDTHRQQETRDDSLETAIGIVSGMVVSQTDLTPSCPTTRHTDIPLPPADTVAIMGEALPVTGTMHHAADRMPKDFKHLADSTASMLGADDDSAWWRPLHCQCCGQRMGHAMTDGDVPLAALCAACWGGQG